MRFDSGLVASNPHHGVHELVQHDSVIEKSNQMRLLIVTPTPKGSRQGNRITANRWAQLLRQLGHHVTTAEAFRDQPCDVLIGLHARKSAASIRRYRAKHPDGRLVVVLTGTDLYHDLPQSRAAQCSIELADRLVVLQARAVDALPRGLRAKARVIVQSAVGPTSRPCFPKKDVFEVCVVGHLRPVKDPFRTALAARHLPPESQISVLHLGAALDPKMERRAREEMLRNPRYHWLGDLPHARALRVLARSRVLVNSSTMEGGANAICEALACGVPVLSSRIAGSIGLLEEDYLGYFEVGDTLELATLLSRFERDAVFRERLKSRCRSLARIVEPKREREAWRQLLSEL